MLPLCLPLLAVGLAVRPQVRSPQTLSEADRIFSDAEATYVAARSLEDVLSVPPLFERIVQLDYERLVASEAEDGARRAVNITCMQPEVGEHGHEVFQDELLRMPLRPGRRCTDGACSCACSRVFRRHFASPEECAALVALATPLMPAVEESPLKIDLMFEEVVEAMRADKAGAAAVHLRLLRLVERITAARAGWHCNLH